MQPVNTMDSAGNVASEAGLGDVQIPAAVACAIRKLFGDAKVQLVSELDPAIPSILKPAASGQQQTSNVLALNCENGLGVLISEPRRLEPLETSHPELRQSTVTFWRGRYLHWVRFDPKKNGEKSLLGPDH